MVGRGRGGSGLKSASLMAAAASGLDERVGELELADGAGRLLDLGRSSEGGIPLVGELVCALGFDSRLSRSRRRAPNSGGASVLAAKRLWARSGIAGRSGRRGR